MNTARTVAVPVLPALFLLALSLLALGSCAGMAERPGGLAFKEAPEQGLYAEELAAPEPSPAAARSAADAGAPSTSLSSTSLSSTSMPSAGQPPLPRDRRARVYSGWLRLVVDEVLQARKQLEEMAVAAGGYVEAVNGPAVSLRVPAARFQESFAAVQKLGEVTGKAVETYDVSDALRDQETRLRLAERARERLYQLLERNADVEQRLAILREIRRLTEEIEQVRLSLELLKNQVALSRITVELLPRRPEGEARRAGIPFGWIAALQPLYPSLPRSAGKEVPRLGEEFAVFDKEKRFRAESPEGTRVRLGTTANRPLGDEEFWQKALLFHLGPRYRAAEALAEGGFRGVLLTSKDASPYSYLVAVRVQDKLLHVFEAFFPDPEALQRRGPAVRQALRDLEIRGRGTP